MIAKRIVSIASAIVLATGTYAAATAADLAGTWAISPAASAGKYHFDLTIEDTAGHDHSHTGNDYTVTALGLTQQQLAGPGHHVRFKIVRDAGTFDCDGWVANARGGGTVTFAPSADYISKMNARGYDPSTQEIVAAAMLDVSTAYIDDLTSAGVEKPTFENLIAMRALNVDAAYVNAIHGVGLNVSTPHDLIELKALKIDAAYVKSLANAGYSNLSSHQLVELRALRIDADYVRRVKAHGIPHPSVEDLVRLKSMDVL